MADEMKTLVGAITDKFIKNGKGKTGNDYTVCIFTLGDNFKVSTFNKEIIDAYEIGNVVKAAYTVSDDGKYNNLVGFEEANNSEIKIQTADKIDDSKWLEKDKRIIRQNCNQRALEFIELMHKVAPEKLKEIMKANNDNLLETVDIASAHFENRVWR